MKKEVKRFCIKESYFETWSRKGLLFKGDSIKDEDPQIIAYYGNEEEGRKALQDFQSTFHRFSGNCGWYLGLKEWWLCELDEWASDMDDENYCYSEFESSSFSVEDEKVLEEVNNDIYRLWLKHEDDRLEERYRLENEGIC